jgi:2-dehydropantoate 2-reductase
MIRGVCVVGAGVIGSLYAGHIARVVPVSILTRRQEHADALERDGLLISGKSAFRARVQAAVDPAELPPFDLCILATKATDLDDAARMLGGRFADATVMTIQNGLGAEEIVSRHGPWKLISALTFMNGVRHSDTHVEYELDTETWIGPYAGTETPQALVQEAHELLERAELRSRAFSDLRPAQWSKLIFNASVNTVSALADLPHMRAFADESEPASVGHLVHALMEEGNAVARAAGVELYEDPWEMNLRAIAQGETTAAGERYAHITSMQDDVRRGRRTEIDAITGALVREAQRLGVPVELHTAMYRLIRARE